MTYLTALILISLVAIHWHPTSADLHVSGQTPCRSDADCPEPNTFCANTIKTDHSEHYCIKCKDCARRWNRSSKAEGVCAHEAEVS